MIIVKASGSLAQQLGQYAFGLAAALHLNVELKLDLNAEYALLDSLGLQVVVADAAEVAAAKHFAIVSEQTRNYDASIWERLCDGVYLDGIWADCRYAETVLPVLRTTVVNEVGSVSTAIVAAEAVALDLRPNQALPPAPYFEDALAELFEKVPSAHLYVFCEDAAVPIPFNLGENYTLIDLALSDAEALLLMSACKHHMLVNHGASFWAARLGLKAGSLVIAPQQIYAPVEGIDQPVWPSHWLVLPTRLLISPAPYNPAIDFRGGTSLKRPMRVAVSNFYDRYTTDGYLFKNTYVANGHNSFKPWCDLYDYGQAHGIDFVTLDQVADIATDLDAVVFVERPKPGNALSDAALQANIVKILLIYECPLIKPDNWDTEYHKQFDRIFTWGDDLVDGHRYIKNNFVSGLELPYDFAVLKSAFAQRKLATMINSSVLVQDSSRFPSELYTHRVRTIRWFEANAPQDFDLHGLGWDANMFPSYKGRVRDKLATLSHYRFAICYENAQGYAGYISEKIQDCLLAGVVPVYGGAPNIARWIPSDCYIDISQFQTYDALYAHLSGMDSATHAQYLDRIHHFFTSGKAYPFSTECFITTLTKFLSWDVQAKRADMVEWAQDDANAITHRIEQNIETLQVNVLRKQVLVPELPVNPALAIRQSMCELKCDDLIISLGYGSEMPVFLRARAIWELYASHFPNIKLIFMRDSDKVPCGEIVSEGNDLVIGIGKLFDRASSEGYASSGVWSSFENERTIFRQMALYDYLMRKYPHPFHLYTCTITSMVDFRGLISVLGKLPRERCFAGMLGRLVHAPYMGVGMVHGANTLVSRDVMELMRKRYVQGHEYTRQPNDHWQGLVLQDVSRTALPLFSFNKPRSVGENLDDITRLTRNLLRDGHYHFRIKTTSAEAGLGKREDVDPWIMLKIMEAILQTPPSPEQNLSLQQRFARSCEPGQAQPRDFPIDDSETGFFYPA